MSSRRLLLRITLLTSVLSTPLLAEDLTTTEGKTYKGIKITSQTPEVVKLMHSEGFIAVPKRLLPADFITQHGLTPAKVSQEEVEAGEQAEWLAAFKVSTPTFQAIGGTTYKSADIISSDPSGLRLRSAVGILRVRFDELPAAVTAAFHYDPAAAEQFDSETRAIQQQAISSARDTASAVDKVERGKRNVRLYPRQRLGDAWICRTALVHPADPFSSSKPKSYAIIEEALVYGLNVAAPTTSKSHWAGVVYRIGSYMGDAKNGSNVIPVMHTSRETAIEWVKANGLEGIYDPLKPRSQPKTAANTSTTAKGPRESINTVGFAISEDGYIVTRASAVSGARTVIAYVGRFKYQAIPVVSNDSLDIAILKVKRKLLPVLLLEDTAATLGGKVFATGFPPLATPDTVAHVINGQIAELSGLKKESDRLQTTLPAQPGDLGGPVCTPVGEALGMLTSTPATSPDRSRNAGFVIRASAIRRLAGSVPDLKLATGIGLFTGSAEQRIASATFYITAVR
jgi:S1-C subfamily serine protease